MKISINKFLVCALLFAMTNQVRAAQCQEEFDMQELQDYWQMLLLEEREKADEEQAFIVGLVREKLRALQAQEKDNEQVIHNIELRADAELTRFGFSKYAEPDFYKLEELRWEAKKRALLKAQEIKNAAQKKAIKMQAEQELHDYRRQIIAEIESEIESTFAIWQGSSE